MLLIDVNLLLYAHLKHSPFHERARDWLDEQLGGTGRVGMPWLSLLGFLRITTNPRMMIRPEPLASALDQVREWLDNDLVWIPEPTPGHGDILRELLLDRGSGGDTVSDAYLAALAMEHGLTLCSNDRDFARFPNLRWMNPLS